MRSKFFLLVFSILIALIVIVSALQFVFFENERQHLIDQRLEAVASSLLASGLSMNLIDNLESTDDLISDLLGEERVDQLINIYSDDGEVLARNVTAAQLPLVFSQERWQTLRVGDLHVRVLNLQRANLVIQVGVVLAPSLLHRWKFLNWRFSVFMVAILLLAAGAAYFGSYLLFSPLRKLTREFTSMSLQLERKLGQPLTGFVIGQELNRLTKSSGSRDEFQVLCEEIKTFLQKLEGYTRSFTGQTAILTHELKTPLTVLRNMLEEIKAKRAIEEVDQLTRMINEYLQWSVLVSNPQPVEEIHAVRLQDAAKVMAENLNRLHADRIHLKITGEAKVFASPDHLRQLMSNLLSNALNYSKAEVEFEVSADALTVRDRGPGLPQEVLTQMGTPFNRGDRPRHASSGLGLAWVHALCEKYGWRLKIESNAQGTLIQVNFHGPLSQPQV